MMASSVRGGVANEKAKADALQHMDLAKIMRGYIIGIVNAAQGYKALIVDKDTMRVTSSLLGRTELGEHNIVLVERLEAQAQGKHHEELKAMCFIRPTRENIKLLTAEIKAPRFQAYYLYFTNLVSPLHLQELAEADAIKENVQEVHEFYGDFIALDSCHFTVPCSRNELLLGPRVGMSLSLSQENEMIDRFVQGLSALFMAVKRRPVIRYQLGSDLAHRLADSLYQLTYKQQSQVFHFGSPAQPIVLLLDRKDDPVTPLLTQWTYQAMIHELLGMQDGKVVASASSSSGDMVLDHNDDFYSKHLFSNYGEVGIDVKRLMDQFQTNSEKHKQVESLEDMKRFIAEHEEFQRLQNNVTKHVGIMSEVADVIRKRSLLEVSSAEQELATSTSNPSAAAASFEDVMRMPSVQDRDKVRLAMLYALRFESDQMRVRQMLESLTISGIRERDPKLFSAIDTVLRHSGSQSRVGDLYASRSAMNKTISFYTQHTPLLSATLQLLTQDRLKPSDYPYMMSGSQEEVMSTQAAFRRAPAREIIVFIIGGSTYEEAKCVHEWNRANPNTRVLLGGSAVLNSAAFLDGLNSSPLRS
jgi:vacuolar protein sorting-associated protein 45